MTNQATTERRPQAIFFDAQPNAQLQSKDDELIESAFDKRERELAQMSKEERQALNAEMFEYFYS